MDAAQINTPGPDAGPCTTQDFGSVRLFFMNEPDHRNALSMRLREGLETALNMAVEDSAVRAIVLAGTGPVFCAGGDISTMKNLDGVSGRPRLQRVHRIFRQLYNGPKPVIAAVEGAAIGAGLSLATACDIIVAGAASRFGAPFNRIGVMADLGLLFTLPARIGLGRTKLLTLTGRIIDTATAEHWGLVDEVVPAGEAVRHALTLAEAIGNGAPLAHAMTKQMLARLPLTSDNFLAAEADAQSLLFTTDDFAEGRDAFLEKRDPCFTGR